MRKKELRLYLIALLLLALAAGAYFLLLRQAGDSTPPEITLSSDLLQISVNDPEEAILAGVTATDDRDGDVTGLTVVESISDLTPEHTATVTYAAFDLSGNVTKATRTLHYTDYTPPVFSLSAPLVFTQGSSADVLGRVKVTDALDGDISHNLKAALTGESNGLSDVGTHQVAFRVTNSMGDTARITLPVDILPGSTYSGTVNLTKNIVYLKQGVKFRANDYFESMQLSASTLTRADGVELTVVSDVNTSTPGVYSVAFTARYNTAQAFTRLIVVVE